MTDVNLQGRCLCGAVEISVENAPQTIGACHCSNCRKWTGSPMMTIESHGNVALKGEDQVGIYASSAWAERAFCKTCGTHLFYRLKQNQTYFLPAGLFDLPDSMKFDHQIFVDEKPAFYDFSNQTHNMTGAEVFALYAPAE